MEKFFERFKRIRRKDPTKAQDLVNDAFYYSEKIITNLKDEGKKYFRVKFGNLGEYTTFYLIEGSSFTKVPGFGLLEPPKVNKCLLDAVNIVRLADGLIDMEERTDPNNPWMKEDMLDIINDGPLPSVRLVNSLVRAMDSYYLREEGYCTVEEFLEIFESKEEFEEMKGIGEKTAEELHDILRRHGIRAWD